MTKSWRSEGWKQPDLYCRLANVECIPKLSAYEAGADAMLKALREKQKVGTKYLGGNIMDGIKDVLVLIPDDDEY